MTSNRGFSHVELLVVVAVIAVLLALLMPGLAKARANSRRTACLSNTKTMTQSFTGYVTNWNALLTLDQSTPNETGNWMRDLAAYGAIPKVRECASATGNPQRPGTASAPWLWPDVTVVTGAYAFNGWLYNPHRMERPKAGAPFNSSGTDLDVDNPEPGNFYRLPFAKQTSTIPVFTDAIWSEAFPISTDFVADLEIGSYTSCADQMGRVAIARHYKTVDVSFLDGHSENIPIQVLWTLEWNAQWTTPAVLPIVP